MLNKSQSRYWEIAGRKGQLSDHELPSYYTLGDIEITIGRLNPDAQYHLSTPFTADELVAFGDSLRELIVGLVAQEEQEEAEDELDNWWRLLCVGKADQESEQKIARPSC